MYVIPGDLNELSLEQSLISLIQQLPDNRLTTFGDLAKSLGEIKAAIWVYDTIKHWITTGQHNELDLHRILKAQGILPFAEIFPESLNLLTSTGHKIEDEKILDFNNLRYHDFQIEKPPFEILQQLQTEIAAQFKEEELTAIPELIGALDIAYPAPQSQRVAFIIWNTNKKSLEFEYTLTTPCTFPYVPGYLAFREIPGYLQLLTEVSTLVKLPELILIDGQGILHHRQCGIATHLGVLTNTRTIGVGKSFLFGKRSHHSRTLPFYEETPLQLEDKIIGLELKNHAKKQILYISPGHRTDINLCSQLFHQLAEQRDLCPAMTKVDRLSKGKK